MFKVSALIATAIFVLCDSTVVQKDKRCKVTDEKCQKSLLENLLKEAYDGNSDPLIIKDYNIQLLGMLNVTLTDGVVKGFKSCYCTGFKNNVEAGRANVEIMCDHVSIEGNYIGELTPALAALAGDLNVQAKGTGSSDLEKLKVDAVIAYEVKKLDDGEVHLILKREESSASFEVLGKLKVASKKFYLGEKEISTIVVKIINDNWKFFINTFGQPFVDIVLNYTFKEFEQMLKTRPAKEFIIDDLTRFEKYNMY